LTAIGLEDEEFGHEEALRAGGERAFVDDKGKTGDLLIGQDKVGKAPETI
jgi:hypothetical protein